MDVTTASKRHLCNGFAMPGSDNCRQPVDKGSSTSSTKHAHRHLASIQSFKAASYARTMCHQPAAYRPKSRKQAAHMVVHVTKRLVLRVAFQALTKITPPGKRIWLWVKAGQIESKEARPLTGTTGVLRRLPLRMFDYVWPTPLCFLQFWRKAAPRTGMNMLKDGASSLEVRKIPIEQTTHKKQASEKQSKKLESQMYC